MHQELEDLILDCHIQGGGRLIGQDDLGGTGKRRGDHHPLTHPPAKLMGIIAQPSLWCGDTHLAHKINRPLLGHPLRIDHPMCKHGFHNLRPNAQDWVERGHRVLHNRGDLFAADLVELTFREGQQILPFVAHLAVGHLAWRRHQPQDRTAGHALARTTFADNAKTFAGV